MLVEAGKHYGEGIIKNYSVKLTNELGKGYSLRNLYDMKSYYSKFNENSILHAVRAKLFWNHYKLLVNMNNDNMILYYIDISLKQNLGYRELHDKIKTHEYDRLDDNTKMKLITIQKEDKISDFIKNPILIKNSFNYTEISEKMLQKLILEDLPSFLKEL